jgi:uncharacterized OsmC-like protein
VFLRKHLDAEGRRSPRVTGVDDRDRDAALQKVVTAAAGGGRTLFTFRAAGTGAEGVRTEVRIRGHDVVVDEPPGLGGEDAAPSPVETALAALLSCQVVTYRLWAAQLGVPLEVIEVEVEGDLDVRGFYGLAEDDGAVRPGFDDVRVRVRLTGPAGAQRYRELRDVVDAHCPVLDLFRSATAVRTELVQDGSHE